MSDARHDAIGCVTKRATVMAKDSRKVIGLAAMSIRLDAEIDSTEMKAAVDAAAPAALPDITQFHVKRITCSLSYDRRSKTVVKSTFISLIADPHAEYCNGLICVYCTTIHAAL